MCQKLLYLYFWRNHNMCKVCDSIANHIPEFMHKIENRATTWVRARIGELERDSNTRAGTILQYGQINKRLTCIEYQFRRLWLVVISCECACEPENSVLARTFPIRLLPCEVYLHIKLYCKSTFITCTRVIISRALTHPISLSLRLISRCFI